MTMFKAMAWTIVGMIVIGLLLNGCGPIVPVTDEDLTDPCVAAKYGLKELSLGYASEPKSWTRSIAFERGLRIRDLACGGEATQ